MTPDESLALRTRQRNALLIAMRDVLEAALHAGKGDGRVQRALTQGLTAVARVQEEMLLEKDGMPASAPELELREQPGAVVARWEENRACALVALGEACRNCAHTACAERRAIAEQIATRPGLLEGGAALLALFRARDSSSPPPLEG